MKTDVMHLQPNPTLVQPTPEIAQAESPIDIEPGLETAVSSAPQTSPAPPNAPEIEPSPKWQIGVSLPPLDVEDLPTPEQAFGLKRLGIEELFLVVLGPSVIALGISLGSGEWLLGPLNVSRFGFRGIGWVILVSAILQVFYNVELARYTLATGETPIAGFGRIPPGRWLWIPLGLFCFYLAFILGGWTVSAGASLYTLVVGQIYQPQELELVRLLGIALLAVSSGILLVGRRIERTLEAFQAVFLPYILIGLLLITLVIVPVSYWFTALSGILIPARPPQGTDPSLLGALAGFTALASGLNYMFIGYYRDKGYGMGSKVGFLPGWFGGKAGLPLATGKTFAENARNANVWNRWFRLLVIDQWGVYFIGVLLAMILPSILIGYLTTTPGINPPTDQNIIVYGATELGKRYGPLLSGWMLLSGFIILFTTQLGILDLLARNLTDSSLSASERVRRWTRGDARRFYYPVVIGLIILISVFIHLALPSQLILLSANLSNLAALIFPIALIYLNRQLPRPARIRWWSYVALVANFLFFGFFFLNFLAVQITGTPLLKF